MIISSCILAATLIQPEAAPVGRVDAFPGVVVDYDARTIELAGVVPIDAHSEETPDVWVELVAESGGVRDHEALVRIEAEARHVHAALLLLGLEPGEPGASLSDGTRRDPTGPAVSVVARYDREGETVTESPLEWVHDPDTGERLTDRAPSFVFAGSSEREFGETSVYMAQAEGVVIGLCTFGTGDDAESVGIETIGMIPVFSPDTASGDPLWMADADRVPDQSTPVTLVVAPIRGE